MDERTVNTDIPSKDGKVIFRDGNFKILGDSKLKELKCIHDWIMADLDSQDSPSAFFMNPLADLTCRKIEVEYLIDTIINVQPKEGGGDGGPSKEVQVENMVNRFKVQ